MSDETPDPSTYLDHLEAFTTNMAIRRLRDYDELLYLMMTNLKEEAESANMRPLEADRLLKETQGAAGILWDKYQAERQWNSRQRVLLDYNGWKVQEDY